MHIHGLLQIYRPLQTRYSFLFLFLSLFYSRKSDSRATIVHLTFLSHSLLTLYVVCGKVNISGSPERKAFVAVAIKNGERERGKEERTVNRQTYIIILCKQLAV